METRYSKFLTMLLIIIIIGIIGLLGYLAYDYFKSTSINKEAADFVQTFTDTSEETINETNTNSNTSSDQNVTENENTSNEIEIEDINPSNPSGGTSSGTTKYKGYNVLGTIQIPKTNVEYPILEKPTREALEIAVAALYPKKVVLNTEGNVVIIGHNYRNGKFFSNNKKLSKGDKIYITDLNKEKVTYVIYKIFQADENDTSFYNRDTNGAKEITLSTCTDDSSARTIIFAKAQ